ncbi:sulfatase family protein [Nocardioides terrigena]|uniref:sulfatase family protein n=1 Tax=Nocardioides terrigena TaxID=424797 RepID=UPI000D321229|nr:sulfatase [Nocardioides terrigena]
MTRSTRPRLQGLLVVPHRSTRPLRRPLAALVVVAGLALVAPVASPGTSPVARSATAGAGSPAPGTATTAGRGTAVAEEPPNVVMVLTDDMRKDDMRHMPHVRELLVDRGMTFRQAQSPHPLCCPARAEILSGQYAQNNGVHHNSGPYGGWQAFDPSSTIATWAQDEGYRTALHGKHLNHFERGSAADPGWTNFDILIEPATDYANFDFFGGTSYRNDYVTTRLDQRTVSDLERWAGPTPYLVMANHVAPHIWMPRSARGDGDGDRGGRPPKVAPEHKRALARLKPAAFKAPSFNEADMSDKEKGVRSRAKVSRREMSTLNLARIRSLLSVDDAVKHLVDTLRETGELDNTYIVFTSDNGYALGEHRFTGKDRLSDEILDVPLVVRGPGVPAGKKSDRLVSLVDLTATLTSLMDLSPDITLDGEDFSDTLLGGKATHRRDTMLIQTGGKATGVRDPGWTYRGVLTERYAYGRRVNDRLSDGFLYDRAQDPYELRNLIRSKRYAPVRRELERRLRALGDCAGNECNRHFGRTPKPRG